MKTIKSIDLVFENVESLTINEEQIENILIGDIKRNIYRFASNAIGNSISSDMIHIEIKSSFNKLMTGTFGDVFYPFDRIKKYNDITSITINYEDGNKETIYTIWNDEDEYSNKYQSTTILKNNNLKIRIFKLGEDDV